MYALNQIQNREQGRRIITLLLYLSKESGQITVCGIKIRVFLLGKQNLRRRQKQRIE
jgi:hypothetical protein